MRVRFSYSTWQIVWLISTLLLLGLLPLFQFGRGIDPEPRRHPKLADLLADLAQATPQGREMVSPGQRVGPPPDFSMENMPKSIQDAVHSRRMRINKDAEVQVYILVAELSKENLRQLRASGVSIELKEAGRRMVQARIPVTRLEMVADLPFVRLVRLPNYAFRHTGSVDTEGDTILKADQVRAQLHVDGTGVKVGVISDGIKGIFATGCTSCSGVVGGPISTGDLPSATGTRNASGILASVSGGITAKSFITSPNLEGDVPAGCAFAGAGAEGTAMLEIIYDLAPGAQLSFANADTDVEFNQAVNFLANTNDVVVDDLGFFAEPYDGTSNVSSNTASALNSSANPIRAYFTAVGNEAKRHYEEDYLDSTTDGTSVGLPAGHLHLFQATAGTTDVLLLGPQPFDKIQLPVGAEAAIILNWDDPFGASTNDYDLYLRQESTGKMVASGTGRSCVGPSNPVECIDYVNNTGIEDFFHIIIQNTNNKAATRKFDMFVLTPECAAAGPVTLAPSTHEKHNYNTPAGSIPAESDAGGSPVSVTSVGAICSGSAAATAVLPSCGTDPSHTTIEFFSSNGPTQDGRMKPDVTGIDGVSVTGAGSFENPFFGTSAAAPHAAGVAALLLEAAPCLRSGTSGARDDVTARTNLRNLILNNAVGLGASGPDDVFGHGRIDALASANQTIPSASGVTNKTMSGNAQTGANIPLNGIGFSDPNGCPLMFSWTGGCGSGSGASINCPFGTNTVSLTATNNSVTMSPTASISITVTNFMVGVLPAQASVSAGQSAKYTVTVTPQFGAFSSAVSLGCSGLPASASCSFTSGSVTPGAKAVTSTLTLSTTAASAFRFPFGPQGQKPLYLLLEELGALALIAGVFAGRKLKRRKLGLLLPAAVALAFLAIQVACGGGKSSSTSGTPTGTYTINITGTAGSLLQSGSATLTVQ